MFESRELLLESLLSWHSADSKTLDYLDQQGYVRRGGSPALTSKGKKAITDFLEEKREPLLEAILDEGAVRKSRDAKRIGKSLGLTSAIVIDRIIDDLEERGDLEERDPGSGELTPTALRKTRELRCPKCGNDRITSTGLSNSVGRGGYSYQHICECGHIFHVQGKHK